MIWFYLAIDLAMLAVLAWLGVPPGWLVASAGVGLAHTAWLVSK